MKVVILAGGFGTRISEESHLKPKPMIEIGGMPIIWHIMKYFYCYGFDEFVICCGYKGYIIKEYFADYYLHRSDVTFDFSCENKMIVHNNLAEPWKVTLVDTGLDTQTGGRLKRISSYIGNEQFFMTYGDGLSDVNLSKLLEQHNRSGKYVTLSAIQPGGRYGVLDIANDNQTVVGFREKATKDGGWINAGFMVMQPEVFDYIEGDQTFLEMEPMQKLSMDQKLGVYKHYGYWQCMDTQRDRNFLETRWNNNNAPWKKWDE